MADMLNLKQVSDVLGLGLQRTRALATAGKIPGGQKDEKGFWKYDKQQVEDFAKNRPVRQAVDGKTYRVKLSQSQYEAFTKAMPDIPLTPAYAGGKKKAAPAGDAPESAPAQSSKPAAPQNPFARRP